MSDTPADPQRPDGEPAPDPTAADWTPPVDATQPIDPSVTSALPVPPVPATPPPPPANPYGPPPVSPYAGPPSNPYATPPATGNVPPPPGAPAYGQHPPMYGQGTPPNPYAVNQGGPVPHTNPYASGVPGAPVTPGGYPQPGQPPFSYQQAPQNRTNVSAIVLLILSGLSICCLVEIPAAILAIVALSKQNDDPAGSRRITMYGWIAFGVGVVLFGILSAILAANGVFSDTSSSDGYSY